MFQLTAVAGENCRLCFPSVQSLSLLLGGLHRDYLDLRIWDLVLDCYVVS